MKRWTCICWFFCPFITPCCRKPTLRQVWGWDSHSRKWELGILQTPATLKLDRRSQNTLLWNVFYIVGKALKCRCRKWPYMIHSDICSTSYGQKKGQESTVWLPTTKSQESTWPRGVQVECGTSLESSWGGPEWTNNHQCTSWPFCPLDALRFFIRRRIGFITVHFFLLLTIVLFFFFLFLAVFPGPDLTHTYPVHFPTLISIAPTLVPYLLSPTNLTTLITSYPTDLTIVLTTYPINLATLLITYPTNLTIRFRVETHKLINKFFTNV